MLGFWIIIAHVMGAYITSSDYIYSRSSSNAVYALVTAMLYMIPFVIFLPLSPIAFLVIFVFRFLAIRFSLVDYVIWARDLLAPRSERNLRVTKESSPDSATSTANRRVSIHMASTAIHCVVIALAVIIL